MELAMAVKLLLVFLSLWRVYIVCGKTSIFKDDMELERQLNILNKPPIKTLERRPSSHIVSSPTYRLTSKSVTFGSREPCHIGTVPIPRVQKEDMMKAKSILKNPSSLVGMNGEYSGHHKAFVLVDDVDTKYGAEAHMSVYNLTVPQDLFSAHKLSIENGPDDHLSTIHAGWGVHPTLNGDGLTRLITYWTIHREVTPDYPLSPTLTYSGDIYELVVHSEQDPRTQNWWLVVRHNVAIGYWPSKLFINLAGGTKRVSWGEEGFSGNAGTCPPLGSGHMRDGHYNHGVYFRRINYMTGSTRNQTTLAVFEHVDKSKVYGLKNDQYIRKKDMGYSFTYGGPVGACA